MMKKQINQLIEKRIQKLTDISKNAAEPGPWPCGGILYEPKMPKAVPDKIKDENDA